MDLSPWMRLAQLVSAGCWLAWGQGIILLYAKVKNGRCPGTAVELPPTEMSLSYYTNILRRWIALFGLLQNQGLITSEYAFSFSFLLLLFLVMDCIREGEEKIILIMVETTVHCTEVRAWSGKEKYSVYTIHILKSFLHWHEVLHFFTKSYVKSCNLLHLTFCCPWANSHIFFLKSIQISFHRISIICKQAETEAVLVLVRYRHACVQIHTFYTTRIKT